MDIETEFALYELEQRVSRQLLERSLVHEELADCAQLARIESEKKLLEVVMGTHKLVDGFLALQVADASDGHGHVPGSNGLASVSQATTTLDALASYLKRIADHFDPPPPDIVDSPYVAGRLGCTTTWIADMARRGEIPKSCIVPGTGNGRLWRFYRSRIEEWLKTR